MRRHLTRAPSTSGVEPGAIIAPRHRPRATFALAPTNCIAGRRYKLPHQRPAPRPARTRAPPRTDEGGTAGPVRRGDASATTGRAPVKLGLLLLLLLLLPGHVGAPSTSITNGRLYARRTFVRGVYASEVMRDRRAYKPSDLHTKYKLRLIKQAGFNTVLICTACSPSGRCEFLDAANRLGLAVIVSVRIYSCVEGKACRHNANVAVERTVTQFKHHPALLMWYINDEQGPSAQLFERYRNISRWDGNHAVVQVAANYQCWNATLCASNLAQYATSTDVLGIDPHLAERCDDAQPIAGDDAQGGSGFR